MLSGVAEEIIEVLPNHQTLDSFCLINLISFKHNRSDLPAWVIRCFFIGDNMNRKNNNCHIYGCRNLETRCKDCGRVVTTAKLDDGWISVKQEEPSKDNPFLAATEWGIEMMSWKVKKEGHGFYSYHTPCSCCTGYCSDDFDYWMPLPKPPEPLCRRQENDREGCQDGNQNDNQVDR